MENLYDVLQPIDTGKLFTVIGLVAALAVVFAILIIVVSKVCAVKANEKAETIKENLAGANCGGCGFAGCADFAKALLDGKADITMCGPTSGENKAKIAEVLGVPFSASEEKFAVVHCAGGEKAKDKFIYVGGKDCIARASAMNGNKVCNYACLGGGTCTSVCNSEAIKVIEGVSHTDKDKCSACGLCVKNCPKHIVELIPKSAKIYVACSNLCRGKEVMDGCSVGCIGCGLCAKSCPIGAIEMVDNIPKIDYSKCTGCLTCVSKCPRKTIRKI